MNRKLKRKFRSLIRFIKRPMFIYCTALILFLSAVPFIMINVIFDSRADDGDVKNKRHINPSFETVQTPDKITIYRTGSGKKTTLSFEDYIKGVVSCEMPSSFHDEALKAQAVAARTYSTAKVINAEDHGYPSAHTAAPVCDSTHCQVFKTKDELEDIKGKDWMKVGWKKICNAVEDTEDELLYYNGELVESALFHSSSGGMTENSEDVFTAAVPYLVSVESPYESEATHQNEKTSFTVNEFSGKIKSSFPSLNFGSISPYNIKILSRSNGNRVEKIRIGSAELTGKQVREALGLSSANFTIDIKDDTITFTSNGSGHGVGMSQYGADGMAKEGFDYKKILSHYYSGTEIY